MEANTSTTIASYGDWDFLFANALLEPDGDRLVERIRVAEAAINQRLQEIANRSADNSEKEALLDALRALHSLAARKAGAPTSFG
jgi:hypothetical protein